MNRQGMIAAGMMCALGAAGCELVINLRSYEVVDDLTVTTGTEGTGAAGGTGGAGAAGGAGGSGGTGGVGGTGGGQVCSPGETRPCYTGAEGTQGVGICVGGIQTCEESGAGFGPCEGEVTPAEEDCTKLGNEACTGALGCSDPIWVSQFGDTSNQSYVVLAASQAENASFLAGTFAGGMKIGDTTIVSNDFGDVFVAQLDGAGQGIWATAFNASGAQNISAIAPTPDGGFVIAGETSATIDFGGGPTAGVFIVKFDGSGNHSWTQACSGGLAYARGLAADADGDVVLVGDLAPIGSTTCGDQSMTSFGATDVFVVKLSGATGSVLWKNRFGDVAVQVVSAVAVDEAKNIVLTGELFGTIEPGFPGQPLVDAGNGDAFVMKLGPDGSYKWGKRFGDASGNQAGMALTLDLVAGPLVAGRFESTIDIGAAPSSNGGSDVFLASLSSSGAVNWAVSLGDFAQAPDPASRLQILTDAAGNIHAAGRFIGQLGPGAAGVDSGEMPDLFAAKLDANGAWSWGKRWNAAGDIRFGGLALGLGGEVVVAGGFGTGFDLSPDWASVAVGGNDLFVAGLAP